VRGVYSLILAIVLATGASATAAPEDVLTTIEGHVFNKFTGVPLTGAAVVTTVLDDHGSELGSGITYTDSNGFYSIDVNVRYFVRIEVSCRTGRGVVVSSVTPPRLGPEIVRRHAYLEVPRRRSFTTCLPDS
jgi:hypothetical protein